MKKPFFSFIAWKKALADLSKMAFRPENSIWRKGSGKKLNFFVFFFTVFPESWIFLKASFQNKMEKWRSEKNFEGRKKKKWCQRDGEKSLRLTERPTVFLVQSKFFPSQGCNFLNRNRLSRRKIALLAKKRLTHKEEWVLHRNFEKKTAL